MRCRRAGFPIVFISSLRISTILEEKPPSLWEISVVGGTPRKLADVGLSARVSPDGSKIVFLKGQWDDEEIWLIDTDKNTTSKIVDGGGDHFGPVAWAPDGNKFAAVRMPDHFSRDRTWHSESKFSMRRQDEARRSCRIFDSALPSRGRRRTPDLCIAGGSAERCRTLTFGGFTWIRTQICLLGLAPALPMIKLPIADISVTRDGKRLALLRRDFQTDVYLAELLAQGKQLRPASTLHSG